MNLSAVFASLFGRQNLSVAKVISVGADGRCAATTRDGSSVVLIGEAKAGDTVFYDIGSRKISGTAPTLSVTDIPV